MSYMTAAEQMEVIEGLRELGYNEQDIEQVVDGLIANDYELSWVADLLEAAEQGDDDEWFMCACALGIA